MEKGQEDRIVLMMVSKKWIQVFRDNILIEKGAVERYKSHLFEFAGNYHTDLPDLFPVLEGIGLSSEDADKIWKTLRAIAKGKDDSIQHILDEETEHIAEFEAMIERLETIITMLDESKPL